MSNRFNRHLYGFSGNKLVANAVKKYGLHNFAFIVLETLESVVTQEDNLILLQMENLYIKQLAPDYNIAPQAGNTFGYNHTEETKLNMKKTKKYSDERREQIGSLNRGQNLLPETVELMRESAKNRKPMS